ncbi:MAG: CCDC90 family protein [bacterium]|nr:CCDC90 family protein [bacterium]
MSIEIMELFDIFAESFGKEKAQAAVKDIEALISEHRQESATKENLKETELKLTKEIELIRKEIETLRKETEALRGETEALRGKTEVIRGEIKDTELKLTKEIEEAELKLTKEIEEVRGEIKGAELKLTKEIEEVKLKLTKEIEQVKSSMIKWVAGLLIAQSGVIVTLVVALLK